MEERARRFQEHVRRRLSGRSGRGVRYPAELRQEAVECAREAIGRGATVKGTAAALGLSWATLSRWLEAARGSLRRVEVLSPEAATMGQRSGSLVVVTPQGYRVEGLDLRAVTALLEALR